MQKKLTKGKNRMLAGVCSGLAEYFDADPTLIRALFVLFALLAGSGVLFYIILAIIVPSKE